VKTALTKPVYGSFYSIYFLKPHLSLSFRRGKYNFDISHFARSPPFSSRRRAGVEVF